MKNIEENIVEITETYTKVDLGILSGFKFGIGFALGVTMVSILFFLFFGTLLMTLLSQVTRAFF